MSREKAERTENPILDQVAGGVAAIMKGVVETFFSAVTDKFNFARTGVPITDTLHLRAVFGCFLADEKAIKEVVSCKGASGWKPCVSCTNVVNKIDPGDDGALVHISCEDVSKFRRQTVFSLTFMARDLAAKRATAPKGEFEFLQKAYGLTYCPQAILYDEYTRTVVGFPDSVYWDWMHCLLASGGIGQYHVNLYWLWCVMASSCLKSAPSAARSPSRAAERS